MSYFDVPLDWTRPELPELRDLFVMAYEGKAEARTLAREAGIVPGTFPDQDNMRTTWWYLIDTMARQGKLVRMLEVAVADPVASSYQPRFKEFLAGSPSLSARPPSTDDTWYKGADRDPGAAKQIHLQRLIRSRTRLMDIRLATQVAEIARSVAYLELIFQDGERAYGTGFLIGPDEAGSDLILTNHHNVTHETHGDVKTVTADFDYVEGQEQHPLPVKSAPVAKDAGHDWAVLRLESAVDRKPLALGSPFTVARDDTVVIVQHPLGAY